MSLREQLDGLDARSEDVSESFSAVRQRDEGLRPRGAVLDVR